MRSLAQHPLWLVAGLALWGGCELFSGVGDLHVSGGTGGAGPGSGAGSQQGSGAGHHATHGATGGGGVGGAGAGGNPNAGGANTIGSGASNASSSTGSPCVCGDGFCNPSCGEPQNCVLDCGSASSSVSSSTGSGGVGPYCGSMGTNCPVGHTCCGTRDDATDGMSCTLCADGFYAACISDADCPGAKCCGTDTNGNGWIDAIQCQPGCDITSIRMCKSSMDCPNGTCADAQKVIVPGYRYCL